MSSLVVYGAGGLGREVALLVRAAIAAGADWNFIGFLDDQDQGEVLDSPILGGLDAISSLSGAGQLNIVVAIGSSRALGVVARAVRDTGANVAFPNIAHPSATVAWEYVESGVGNVVCAGARLNNAQIGSHNIINMNTVLGHDCVLGSRNLISPSATLNGEVSVGSDVTIGAGATIMPRVSIGDGATVAIGAVVGKTVEAGETVAGNPARVVARAPSRTEQKKGS